jgi:hypothetical protein
MPVSGFTDKQRIWLEYWFFSKHFPIPFMNKNNFLMVTFGYNATLVLSPLPP